MSFILEFLGVICIVTLSIIVINAIIEYMVWIRPLKKQAIRIQMFDERNLFLKLIIEDELKKEKRK